MWNVGLYDLHALSKRLASPGAYHDCAHLKTSAAAFALYTRLGQMLAALRAEIFESQSAPLCLSSRCRAHNAAVMPPGAPTPEQFDFGAALPLGLGAGGSDGATGAEALARAELSDEARRRRLTDRPRSHRQRQRPPAAAPGAAAAGARAGATRLVHL